MRLSLFFISLTYLFIFVYCSDTRFLIFSITYISWSFPNKSMPSTFSYSYFRWLSYWLARSLYAYDVDFCEESYEAISSIFLVSWVCFSVSADILSVV
jgi:hypothetical protein